MADLDIEICRRFKTARKEKGLSQSFLAGQVGCKQSALSAFENGNSTKLSDAIVGKLSETLGVSLKAAPKKELSPPVIVPGVIVRGFCPDANCPSNVPYMVGEKLFFRPLRAKAAPGGGTRCVCCGEVLERRCPACGAPLNEGACCGTCGSPYISVDYPDGVDLAEWSSRRRAELLQMSSLEG